MIVGKVNDQLRPMIQLLVEGPTGIRAPIDVTVDTGYNGELLLSPSLIESLILRSAGESPAVLADGTIVRLPMFEAVLHWDHAMRRITIDAADSDLLLGMAMLKEYRLTVDGRPGGAVTISALT